MPKGPGEYYGERRRFVVDGLKKLIASKDKSRPAKTEEEKLVEEMLGRLDLLMHEVLDLCRPIQQSGGAVKPDDMKKLQGHIYGWVMQKLDEWDKDILIRMGSFLISPRICAYIENDPWGKGKMDSIAPNNEPILPEPPPEGLK